MPEAPNHAEPLLILPHCGGLQELLHCQSHLLNLDLVLFCFALWGRWLVHDQTIQVKPSAVSPCNTISSNDVEWTSQVTMSDTGFLASMTARLVVMQGNGLQDIKP